MARASFSGGAVDGMEGEGVEGDTGPNLEGEEMSRARALAAPRVLAVPRCGGEVLEDESERHVRVRRVRGAG
jgi:hypothetical protein